MLAIPLATEAVNHGVNHVKNGLELYTSPVVANKLPVPTVRVREHKGRVFYEAMFRYDGKQVGRRVGPAWLEPDGDGGFRKRKGRIEPGYYNDRTVHVRAAEIVERYVSGEEERERATREKLLRGPTFREVANSYLHWVEHVKDATPATLRGYRSLLAEPGATYTRGRGGSGVKQGRIMKALGDRPAAQITTLEINELLNSVAAMGVSAKTVTRSRQILSAVFYYGMKEGNGFDLPRNPVTNAHRRRIAPAKPLVYHKPADIEAIAAAFESGTHRDRPPRADWEVEDDRRDAELIRVAAYTGLRLGELRELRWRDIDWERSAIVVSRSLSAGVEREGTKSRRNRDFGLPQQAADALRRLSQRENFTGPDDLVFCSPIGRRIDDAASAEALQAGADRRRCPGAPPPRPAPQLRVAAGCRRSRSGEHPGRDGPFADPDDDDLHARQGREGAGGHIHKGASRAG